ncbi:DUF3006 domain-containing protein [Acetobacterium wieringae]|uniref:DUF3006 domain-containing protein n=1 Tax=Acetobacterium wieringae TaxID=52694 RepID=A0ABY6HCW0_9FIRM|nr:DUF3006 domain-containing protein [Acetobacterium wieringae]UYO61779.1 DUF3006 domain-containing protein [Acetobacterium wieringae]
MNVIIDRFEGDFVICEKEDRTMMEISRISVPGNAKEGDVLIIEDEEIVIDHEATEQRRREIDEMTKGLWK